MRTIINRIILFLLRITFCLRYRVVAKGVEKLSPGNLKKSGGILFLANHPAALVDPILIALAIFKKFPFRSITVEYFYLQPYVYHFLKYLRALPIPNFETSNNSLKKRNCQKCIKEVIDSLKNGENILLYPAGRIKHTEREKIGGASGVSQIIKAAPEANIVLVRSKGLWGSSFSRALTGKTPDIFAVLKKGLKIILKNWIFFTPRRVVEIEFEPVPKDFPYFGSKMSINRWLENWFNKPDGLSEEARPGDTLTLVSYNFRKTELPETRPEQEKDEEIDLEDIEPPIQNKIMTKLEELTELDSSEISLNSSLSCDLGLDSLDISELAAFIEDQFHTGPIPIEEMITVKRVFGLAARKISVEQKGQLEEVNQKIWNNRIPKSKAKIAEGDTLPAVFLNICDKMDGAPAVTDNERGILTYPQLKREVITLAIHIGKQAGKYIGILLPASSLLSSALLACQLAGKIPIIINWTLGPEYLKAVNLVPGMRIILTSWKFMDALNRADLSSIEDKLVMLDVLERDLPIMDKINAQVITKLPAHAVLKKFGAHLLKPEDIGVIILGIGDNSTIHSFPFSFANILAKQKESLDTINIYTNDIFLVFLPPYIFSECPLMGLIGILAGIRTVYFPEQNDTKALIKTAALWKVTVTCGAPAPYKRTISESRII